MKIVMDADCLIKLTKSGLKECICNAFSVTIPHLVKEEVVDRGKKKGLSDAYVVDKNIKDKLLKVEGSKNSRIHAGEKEAVALFENGGFDAIGSDDKRFIRDLRIFNIPYITPAVFIAVMLKNGDIALAEAEKKLDTLSEYISEHEYYAVKFFIEKRRNQK